MLNETIPKLNGHIAIGVSFDKNLSRLLETATKIFSKGSLTITLLHVVTSNPMLNSAPIFSLSEEVKASLTSQLEEIALERLRMIVSSLPSDLDFKIKVLKGDISSSIAKFVDETGVDLVVLGTTRNKGLKTALSLVLKDTVPVMIVHEDTNLNLSSKTHRIIVGDDMRNGGKTAIAWGFKIVEMMGDYSILHAHVISPEKLNAYISTTRSLSVGRKEEIIREILDSEDNNLQRRFAEVVGIRSEEFAGAYYESHVSIGLPMQELEKSANAFRAEISIFCMHHDYHHETRVEGQVPFTAMIDTNRFCVIVPG